MELKYKIMFASLILILFSLVVYAAEQKVFVTSNYLNNNIYNVSQVNASYVKSSSFVWNIGTPCDYLALGGNYNLSCMAGNVLTYSTNLITRANINFRNVTELDTWLDNSTIVRSSSFVANIYAGASANYTNINSGINSNVTNVYTNVYAGLTQNTTSLRANYINSTQLNNATIIRNISNQIPLGNSNLSFGRGYILWDGTKLTIGVA